MSDKQNIVYNDLPATRPAPIRQTGAWAWIRNNLLKSWSDILLTIIFGSLLIFSVVSFFAWTVRDANWWSVAFNFRQYTISAFESDLEWRLGLAALTSLFVIGMGIAVWIKQLARIGAVVSVIILIMVLVFPPLIIATIPLPQVYVMGGSLPIQVGNVNETARSDWGFLARSGETITVRQISMTSDQDLVDLAGFMDAPTIAIRTVAEKRFLDLSTQAQLQTELATNATSTIPLLTQNQVTKKEAELAKLQIIDPVSTTLPLNTASLNVELRHGSTLEPLGSRPVALTNAEDVATFTVAEDGWYILHTTSPDENPSLAILGVTGMYPILQASTFVPSQAGGGGFVSSYTRMTDNYTSILPIPQINNQPIPIFDIVRNQYWGTRPLDVYLRVYFAPFLQYHAPNIAGLIVAGVAGYWLILLLQRSNRRQIASSLAGGGFLFLLVFIWIMMAGLSLAEIVNLLVVGGAVAFIRWAQTVGIKYGRTPNGIILYLFGAVTVFIMPFWLFNPNYGFGILPIINLVAPVLGLIFFLMGSESYLISDFDEVNRDFRNRLIMLGVLLILPVALTQLGIIDVNAEYPDWFLRHSDQRNWGGLMLTLMLTIYGIVASFPIGVLLALGRRSNLPLIKYSCTAYIEVIRGVPFITVLFLGQLMIPLINPIFAEVPGVIRALVATIMFSAAYLAEIFRGGLQSLPPGQTEAGRALGLSGWQIIYFITMPQAIRAVIPALLGSFISLFKDTSLVAIVGLTDIAGFVGIQVTQQAFNGTRTEGLLFITLIYFTGSYAMSYVSRLIEASGSGVARRI